MCIIVLFIVMFVCFIRKSFGEFYLENTNTATSDFRRIVNSPFFVDKTNMIKVFFQPDGWNVLVTTPRRFGKSTNIDMLRRFVEVNVDSDGRRISKKETENFKVFSSAYNKSGELEYLNIYQDVNSSIFFDATFGEFPVLFLDFKKLSGLSFKSFLNSFRIMVNNEFMSREYLLTSDTINTAQKDYFKMFYNYCEIRTLNNEELYDSMTFLSQLLHSHFNKRVIVLIDEFDKPIQDAIFQSGKDVEKIKGFIQNCISLLLKSNEYVDRALLNGCIRLSGVLSNGLNNIDHFSFNDYHCFKEFYGFTELELKKLAIKLNFNDELSTVRDWYDGYGSTNSEFNMYNVWSIVKYIRSGIFKSYWAEEDFHINLKTLCLSSYLYRKVNSTLLDNLINVTSTMTMSVTNVIHLNQLVSTTNSIELNAEAADLYLNLMLDLGYFTCIGNHPIMDGTIKTLRIPNLEIKNEISRQLKLLEFVESNYGIRDLSFLDSYAQSLINLGKDESSYKHFLNSAAKLIEHRLKDHNRFLKKEADLEHLMSDLPYYATELVHVEVQCTIDRKFSDLIVVRKDLTGIIIEFKYGRRTTSYAGLQQIISKSYFNVFDKFFKDKVNKLILIGFHASSESQFKNVRFSLSYLDNTTDIAKAINVTI